MNEALTKKWSGLRGLSIVNTAVNSITLPQEDNEPIKQAQRAAIMRDPIQNKTLKDGNAHAWQPQRENFVPNAEILSFQKMVGLALVELQTMVNSAINAEIYLMSRHESM